MRRVLGLFCLLMLLVSMCWTSDVMVPRARRRRLNMTALLIRMRDRDNDTPKLGSSIIQVPDFAPTLPPSCPKGKRVDPRGKCRQTL